MSTYLWNIQQAVRYFSVV